MARKIRRSSLLCSCEHAKKDGGGACHDTGPTIAVVSHRPSFVFVLGCSELYNAFLTVYLSKRLPDDRHAVPWRMAER